MRPLIAVVAVLALALGSLRPADGQSVPELVARARPAVGLVLATTPAGVSQGTGFVHDAGGLVATALHVVERAREVVVRLPGQRPMLAVVQQTSASFDLAVLRLPQAGLPSIPLATDPPRPGEEIVVLGYPLARDIGFEDLTVTRGTVSRVLLGDGLLQFDAAVNPGNSGGPVLNLRGQAVGVVSFRVRQAQGISFATLVGPLADLTRLAQQMPYAAPSPPSPPPPASPSPPQPTPRPAPGSDWMLIGEKGPQVRRPEIRSEPNWALRAARVRQEDSTLVVQVELYARLTGESWLGIHWRLPGSRIPRWSYRVGPDGRVWRTTVSTVREGGRELWRYDVVDSRARTLVTGSVIDVIIPREELRESTEWELQVVTCWAKDRICENVDWFQWFAISLR